MKAVLSRKKGPPEILRFADIEKPMPGSTEVLIKVRYGTVTRGDVNMRTFPRLVLTVLGALFGFKPMEIPGIEFSGDVEEVGVGVTAFRPGDAVCGTATGLRRGAAAEYVCVPERSKMGVLVHKPAAVPYREAAAVLVGSMTAMQLLKPDGIERGENVLVYGASGSVGSYAVQQAKLAGANVTAVCGPSNLHIVRSIGADRVIDYTHEKVTDTDERYDHIFDAVGKISKRAYRAILAKGGRFSSVRSPTKERVEEAQRALDLVAEGKLVVVIDREYELAGIVEAHRYVEAGHKKGNVVVHVAG